MVINLEGEGRRRNLHSGRLDKYCYITYTHNNAGQLIIYGIFDDILASREFKKSMEKKHGKRLVLRQYPMQREVTLK